MSFPLLIIIAGLIIAGGALSSSSSSAEQHEYYGVPLGSLRNGTAGIAGSVWLANASAVQVTEFKLDKNQKHEILFAFASNDGKIEAVKSLYKVISADENGEEEALMPIKKKHYLGSTTTSDIEEQQRLVVLTPAGKNVNDFKQFGVVNGKTMKFLSAVSIDKAAPMPFCCVRNADQPGHGIIGEHYSAATGEISVEDHKTLTIHNITLEANRAPDAWIFAGRGEVRQSSGKKAFVVGRDTPSRHCSLRDDYRGDTDLRVRLAHGQTVYGIDYLSLFCYQYDVDFGHIGVQLEPDQHPVPAHIPPISLGQDQRREATAAAKSRSNNHHQIGGSEIMMDVLESNDIDKSC